MMPEEPLDTSVEEPEDAAPTQVVQTKGRQAFSRIRRELSEEELATPAVQRMLVAEMERLDQETGELRDYRDRYYVAERDAAILRERGKRSTAADIIFGVCLSVGAAALAYAPMLWNSQPSGWIAILFGAVLIVAGIAARVTSK
jgi:hypothetical protein